MPSQRKPLANHLSQKLRTPITAAFPSFLSSFPSGLPNMAVKNQKLAATHAAMLTPSATTGAKILTIISIDMLLGGGGVGGGEEAGKNAPAIS